MSHSNNATSLPGTPSDGTNPHHLRFHFGSVHLRSPFGGDWFGVGAERFARFFGTPTFLIAQSALVLLWIALNVSGAVTFDLYPFILLNLAFSLQAAYAAPLILLAQTRQADRDTAAADNDAAHREALAKDALRQREVAHMQLEMLLELMKRNTDLTERSHQLSMQVEALTREIHERVTGHPTQPESAR